MHDEGEANGRSSAKKTTMEVDFERNLVGPRLLANAFGTGQVELLITRMEQEWSDLSCAGLLHGADASPSFPDLVVTDRSNFISTLLWHSERLDKDSLEGQIRKIQSRIDDANFYALFDAATKNVQEAIQASNPTTSLFFQWTNDLLCERGKSPTSRTGRGIGASTMV